MTPVVIGRARTRSGRNTFSRLLGAALGASGASVGTDIPPPTATVARALTRPTAILLSDTGP